MTENVDSQISHQKQAGPVDRVSLIAGVISALAAVAALGFSGWQIHEQVVEFHADRLANNRDAAAALAAEFDSDEMSGSRARLIAFREWLAREVSTESTGKLEGAAETNAVASRTATYFRRYVYQKNIDAVVLKIPSLELADEEKRIAYFTQLDSDRRRFKTYFSRVKSLVEAGYFLADGEQILRKRLGCQSSFLGRYWLPVELGQDQALYEDQSASHNNADHQLLSWLGAWGGADCSRD